MHNRLAVIVATLGIMGSIAVGLGAAAGSVAPNVVRGGDGNGSSVGGDGGHGNIEIGNTTDHGRSADHGENSSEHHGAEFAQESDRWLLRNANVSVWFHLNPDGSAKPQLRVFAPGQDGNVTGFDFMAQEICEVAPNATSCADSFASVRLNRDHGWVANVTSTNGTITIRLTLADPQATVGLVFHLMDNSSAVKFDLNVANWKWQGPGHVLAISMLAQETDRQRGEESRGDDGSAQREKENESRDRNLSVAGSGFIRWAPTAIAMNGTTRQNLTVVSAVGHDNESDSGRLFLRFDGASGYASLAYDPELGVSSTSIVPSASVPGFGMLEIVGAVGVGAILALRRRQ
ncbi:MAG: hypothetical protein ACYDDF_07805 [Thermoplasmatota archaeon]